MATNDRQRQDKSKYRHPAPVIHAARPGVDTAEDVRVSGAAVSLDDVTLGDLGLAARIRGPERFAPVVLVQPFERAALQGFDLSTTRSFRLDPRTKRLAPLWRSGVNEELGFVWSMVSRPGVIVPLALPFDKVLVSVLHALARERAYVDGDDEEAWPDGLSAFMAADDDNLDDLRQQLASMELQTGIRDRVLPHARLGQGGHPLPFALPHGLSMSEVKERLRRLALRPDALPELALLFPPEDMHFHNEDLPWPRSGNTGVLMHHGGVFDHLEPWGEILRELRYCLFPPNWWMLHHDARHGGRAGCSDISSTSVGRLTDVWSTTLPQGGEVVTNPVVVNGKVYVTTYNAPTGGELYRIDVATGDVEATYSLGQRFSSYAQGSGGSPAVVGNRVYVSQMPGRVHCLDATTFAVQWVTDLRLPDPAHNQPVNNPNGDCFSSPLVVNGRVYVGSGEGEYNAWGFVFCLDAATGDVVWLYCMSQFDLGGADNAPNVIPPSTAVSNPLPAWATGFTVAPADPPHRGASVWSSLAYDSGLDRVYACSGNSVPDNPLPDEKYASGIISLDAATGAYRGFFQPPPESSYRPTDMDVDVPCSPVVFTREGQTVVAFGSKNGAFFLLDAATMQVLGGGSQWRQLLPRIGGTGHPGDMGAAIPNFDGDDTSMHENLWGVFASAGVHAGLEKLYVGLGGYLGIGNQTAVPFLRALDWTTLDDAWPTATGADNIRRYTTASPPLYTSGEAGLANPAVVNDVVFMTTSKAALYALHADSGVCLWMRNLTAGAFSLGASVYRNYVVVASGSTVRAFTLRPWWWWFLRTIERYVLVEPPWRWRGPTPDPPPWFGPERFEPRPGPG